MSRPHLLIVDPAVTEAELRGEQEVARGWPGPVTVLRPAMRAGDDPQRAARRPLDAIVVMGSAASVHDRAPWLLGLVEWIAPFVEGAAGTPPLLGICFGHQLIAHCAGGRVGPLGSPDAPPLRAVQRSRLEGCRLLPGRHELTVIVSHREIVAEAPPGWEVVGRRDGVPIDALQHPTRPVFSFQFHPEAGEEFARRRGLDPAALGTAPADGALLLARFRQLALSGAAYP